MQLAACVGTQTDDIARVGRDFRLKQDDMKHVTGLVVWSAYLPCLLQTADYPLSDGESLAVFLSRIIH
jgi:hypothetical protein